MKVACTVWLGAKGVKASDLSRFFKYVRDVFKVNAADGADADHCNFDQIEFLLDEINRRHSAIHASIFRYIIHVSHKIARCFT